MKSRTLFETAIRRVIPAACLAALAVSASSASAQVWLLDFGGSNSYRGASQVGLDANGNQWNSMPPTWYTPLFTTTSGSTGAAYAYISGSPGTDSFNGPLGSAVSNPLTQAEVDAAVIDAAALGLIGGSKAAVVDYQSATQGRFAIKWLDTALLYDATFFGSQRWAADSTVVTAFTNGNYATAVASGTLNVGGGGNYNQSRTITLAGLVPTATDPLGRQLSFQFGGASGTTTGYLNAMSLYGYMGYVSGGTTTLAANPAYIATGMGTYSNGDSRSVDTVLGGGSTLNVTGGVGTYWNSTLVVNPSGGSLTAGVNVAPYRLAGAGTLGVSGTGGLSLSRPGTFSGTLAVNGGLVVLSGSGALGSGGLALNGGTVRISNAQAVGAGGIAVVSGNTTIENSGGINGLSGSLPISLGGGAATLQVWGNTKEFSLGTGPITVQGFNNLNAWDGGIALNGSLVGSGTMNWYGAGSLVLGGSNGGFTGRVIAGTNNGTLKLANVDALRSAILSAGTAHTIAFTVPGTNTYNLAGLVGSGSIGLGGNTLAISGGGSNTFAGRLTGNGGLSISGSGVQVLLGVNTYSGPTTITGGQLAIPVGSINGSSGVSLAGGELRYNSGTPLSAPITFTGGVLSGTGSIASALAVGTGASLAPGNSPGTQAFTGGLALQPGGTLIWETNALTGVAGTNWDSLAVSGGTLDLGGLSTGAGGQFIINLVTLTGSNTPGGLTAGYVDGTTYEMALASYSAGLTVPGGFSTTAGSDLTGLFSFSLANWAGSKPAVQDLRVRVNDSATGLSLVVVPEPSASVIAAAGVAAAAWAARRRKAAAAR